LTTLLPALPSASAAPLLGVNFGSDQSSLAASDSTGVVAQDNWNNASGASGSIFNLVDESGAATTADVTWSSNNTWLTGTATTTATEKLLYGYLDGGSGNVAATVSITSVPFSTYDAYVYIGRDASDSTSTYIVNGNSITVTPAFQPTTFTVAGTATPGTPNPGTAGSYVLFTGLTGDFSLTTSNTGALGNHRSPVNGVQLIAVPEPGSLALFVVGGLGIALVARRKNQLRKL
jgi:hypothetical protein